MPQCVVPGPFQASGLISFPGWYPASGPMSSWGCTPGKDWGTPNQDRIGVPPPKPRKDWGPPPQPRLGLTTPRAVCLLRFPAGELFCFVFFFRELRYFGKMLDSSSSENYHLIIFHIVNRFEIKFVQRHVNITYCVT